MWKIISFLLPWFIVVIILSQVILPLILKRQLFWLFRKKKVADAEEISLEEEIKEAEKEVINTGIKVAGIQEKVNKHYKEAEKLKKKSDSI